MALPPLGSKPGLPLQSPPEATLAAHCQLWPPAAQLATGAGGRRARDALQRQEEWVSRHFHGARASPVPLRWGSAEVEANVLSMLPSPHAADHKLPASGSHALVLAEAAA